MKKPLIIVLYSILLFQQIFVLGCKDDKKDAYQNINYLKNLKSYSCAADITIKNYKQSNTYNTIQYYKKDYGCRMEISNERIYIYINSHIYVKDLVNDLTYSTDNNFDGILKYSLIEEYITLLYAHEGIKYYYKEIGGKKYQLIDFSIPGNDRNLNKAVLYINVKTTVPEKCIYMIGKTKKELKWYIINLSLMLK